MSLHIIGSIICRIILFIISKIELILRDQQLIVRLHKYLCHNFCHNFCHKFELIITVAVDMLRVVMLCYIFSVLVRLQYAVIFICLHTYILLYIFWTVFFFHCDYTTTKNITKWPKDFLCASQQQQPAHFLN